MPHSPMAAATVTAIGQYGVLSYAQARGCGLTKNDLQRLVRQGEWLHPHREVYVVRSLIPEAHSPDRLRCVALAAQLALGPRACAAGRTAARLWGMRGLEPWDGRVVHMAVPGLKGQRRLAGVELRGWDVRAEETTVVGGGGGGGGGVGGSGGGGGAGGEGVSGVGGGGVRVTDPGRTLRDTLPELDRETAVCLMDSALNQKLVREGEIEGVNRAMRGRRGCVDVRRWWGLADRRSQSPLETRIRLICRDGGSPPDELQRRFTDPGGRTVAVVDFWWEGARLIGEADGIGPHSTPRALARDRERQNALLRLYPGVRIVRFTWADLRRPGYILALVAGGGRASA